jgi:hypothetical protein
MYNQKYHQFNSLYNHKFGFHICGPRQDAFDAVLRVRPKIVKTLDFSVEVMKRIRQEIPDVFLIGRLFVHPQDFGQLSGGRAPDARQRGLDMAERILREEVNKDIHHINGRPVFHAWESLNEVFPEGVDADTHKLYEEYQVAFGEKMLAEGFEPIAFNFGQGNGRGKQWLELYPGTLETYKYLGFHEYDWPTMDRLHLIGVEGRDEPENRVPEVGAGSGNDGMWRALRYRRIMFEGVRQKYGDKHVCIITECGMTQGVWGSEDIGPWATQLTVSPSIPGGVVSTPIPVDEYWKSMLWYNSELMKDDYVMGACLFVTGAAGLARWDTFEHLGPFMERLTAFQQEVGAQAAASASTLASPAPARPIKIVTKPLVATTPTSDIGFEAPAAETIAPTAPSAPTSLLESPLPVEIQPVAAAPITAIPPAQPAWQVKIDRDAGLSLLVGDIGVANERITITWPGGQVGQVTGGSKPEYGRGGFEVYAQETGTYKIQFLNQSFDIEMSGQYTRVTFSKPL